MPNVRNATAPRISEARSRKEPGRRGAKGRDDGPPF